MKEAIHNDSSFIVHALEIIRVELNKSYTNEFKRTTPTDYEDFSVIVERDISLLSVTNVTVVPIKVYTFKP